MFISSLGSSVAAPSINLFLSHSLVMSRLTSEVIPVARWGIFFLFLFSELCWGKATVAYTMPQQWQKEESERLRGERDQIKSFYLGFERRQVVRFRKARRRQDVP